MTGLMLKDYYLLRGKWFKLLPLSGGLGLLVIATIFLKNDSWLVAVLLSLMFINSIQSLFLADKKNDWLDFLKTLAVKNSLVVTARYLFIALICGTITIFNGLFLLLLASLYHQMNLQAVGIVTLCVLVFSLFYVLLLSPFLYAFPQNGLAIGVLIFLGSGFVISRFTNALVKLKSFLLTSSKEEISMTVMLALVITAVISFSLSYVFYEDR